MNLDDFEQRLARTPMPTPPADMRRDIFEAVRRERAAARQPARVPTDLAPWRWLARRCAERLSSPWSILGAACAVVLALMSAGAWLDAGRSNGTSVASVSQPRPTRMEVVVAMRSHRSELAALMGTGTDAGGIETPEPAPIPVDRPRGTTRPRTEWRPVGRGAMAMESANCNVV